MTVPLERAPDGLAKHDCEVYRQSFAVPFEYPVYFTRGVFESDNPLLASALDRLDEKRRHRVVACVDAGLAEAQPDLIDRVKEYFHDRSGTIELAGAPQLVPGGERAKTGWGPVRDVMSALGNLHLCRQSYVLAVGGGSVLDMVGFAASIVHRGLRQVRVPTTVLSQNDGGVGVKNGMDEHGVKNFVGTFAPPFAVVNDFEMLRSLPDREWVAGIAEAFKVAIIKDATFFGDLCERAAALRGRDEAAMEDLVRRCAVLHLEHIRTGGDPFERGSARPLDFGHWSSHRLESLSNYEIGHGHAVAVGIALDSAYAARKGLIAEADLERILSGLAASGLPVWDDLLEKRTADGVLEVLRGLEDFREHLGGALTVTLPDGIGEKTEVHQMDAGLIEEAVAFLKARGAG